MGEVPLALHLSRQMANDLAREAGLQSASVDEVARVAIEAYLDRQAFLRAVLQERIEEAKKGVFVSSEAVLDWMEALDDDINAPFPEPDVFPSR